MEENIIDKVNNIVTLYTIYKHQMNTPQRIGLLTLWIECSVSKEEYEVAGALQKELDNILDGNDDFIMTSPTTIMGTPTNYTPPVDSILTMDNKRKTNKLLLVFIGLCVGLILGFIVSKIIGI